MLYNIPESIFAIHVASFSQSSPLMYLSGFRSERSVMISSGLYADATLCADGTPCSDNSPGSPVRDRRKRGKKA